MPGFTDIARRVPVAQNQHALAFLAEDALVPGRTALVFHRHITSWWAATAAEQQSMLDLLAAAKVALDERFGPSGYSVRFETDPGDGDSGGVVVHLLLTYAGNGSGGHRRVEAVTR